MGGLAGIPDLVRTLSADLTRSGVPHAVTGAVAMAAHGYVRATVDLDILVVVPAVRWPEVFRIVRAHGFQGEDRELILTLRERGVAELTSVSARVEILVPMLPYHRQVLDRAVAHAREHAAIPYVTVEDLIVLKLLWRRAKDVADVQKLIESNRGALDVDYVRSTLGSILPDDDPRHAELEHYLARFGRR